MASPTPTLEQPAEGFRPPATLDGLPARLACFAEMRETTPVLRDEADGTWHVFRYEDVGRVLTDHAVFSNETVAAGPAGGEAEGIAASMIAVDPPRHRQLRGLVSQVFTPKAVKALAPRIEALARDLLDPVRPRGTMDLVGEFASPLPVAVIAEMLGIPLARRADFRRWSDGIVAVQPRALDDPESGPGWATREMTAYFRTVLAERRDAPGDDLIGGLLTAEIDGRRLTEAELIGFCQLLLVAGNETTMNLIANAVVCFDEHPAAANRLRREPELMPAAIEEVLRYLPSVWLPTPRRVTADVDLGGRPIPRGAMVFPWLVSANRDPRQFPDPDRFDIARAPNRHRTFGHGIHACLGAPLARLEAAIALPMLLECLPDLRVVRDAPIPVVDSGVVFGPTTLPVAFTPSEPVAIGPRSVEPNPRPAGGLAIGAIEQRGA